MIHTFLSILFLAAGLLVLAFGGFTAFNGLENRKKGLKFLGGSPSPERQQKMKIDPKSHYAEPGICQCACALSYHRGAGACNVPGCPCQQFIPSNLSVDELGEVANATITRIAIENVNERLTLETKTKALETAIRDRELRNEMATKRSITDATESVYR